ncbi:hypothetical protein [Actinoplanes sp. NPDC051859]|uniref:hypothetical protein n=1 Tax=Actinoplanes sp. NPDC051859 TaxID=3363909 RepID=UPI0037AC3B0D
MLSGAAAHAAGPDQAPDLLSTGTSLLGAVVHGEPADVPVVGGVLEAVTKPSKAAEKPSKSGGNRTQGLLTQVTTIPQRLVGTVDKTVQVTRDDAGSALRGADDVVRGVTEPGAATPVRPAGEVVDAEEPAPVPDAVEPDVGATTPAPQASQPVKGEQKSAPVRTAKPARHKVGKTAARHSAAAAVSVPETVRETPDGDGPAPLQVHLGAANGFPTSGAGTATDGGPSAAVLPSAVADSSTACCRLSRATDVEVRRHDAEAPTVSPD